MKISSVAKCTAAGLLTLLLTASARSDWLPASYLVQFATQDGRFDNVLSVPPNEQDRWNRSAPAVYLTGEEGGTSYHDHATYYSLGYAKVHNWGVTASFNDTRYTLKLTFLRYGPDANISQQGSLLFPGRFDGVSSPGGSTVRNTFLGPTRQSLTLGGDHFVVTLFPFTPIATGSVGIFDPSLHNIEARIAVNGAEAAPEPSSLVLAGVGLSALAFAFWRKLAVLLDHAADTVTLY